MRHKFPVLAVKTLLKSVYIYGSYRKNKTGVPFFLEHPVFYDDMPFTKLTQFPVIFITEYYGILALHIMTHLGYSKLSDNSDLLAYKQL